MACTHVPRSVNSILALQSMIIKTWYPPGDRAAVSNCVQYSRQDRDGPWCPQKGFPLLAGVTLILNLREGTNIKKSRRWIAKIWTPTPKQCQTQSLLLLKQTEVFFHQDRCRATVLSHLTHEEQIDQLKLPLRIKHFISEGLENFQVLNTHYCHSP